MRPVKRSPQFVVITTVFFVGAAAVASAAFWPVYETSHFVLLVAATLAVGCGIAIAGARFGWPGPVVLAATVAAFFAFGVPLAVPASAAYGVLPTGQGVVELITGSALGWRQLLTISLPVGTYQSLLVPAFALILAASVVGLSLALRLERGELGAIAPAIILLAGLAFGPADAPLAVVTALSFLVVTLSWLSWRHWYRRREAIKALSTTTGSRARERSGGIRLSAIAAIILVVSAAMGAATAENAPPVRDRTVLRDTVVQPFDPRNYPSPLAGLRQYHQAPVADEEMFRVSGMPDGARIRLATLDTYDGVVFSVGTDAASHASGSFARLPTEVARDVPDGTDTRITIDVVGYEGVWVPTVGLVKSVSFGGPNASDLLDGFFYNQTGNAGVSVHGLDAGDRVRVSAVLPPPAPEPGPDLRPGTALVPPADVVPQELGLVLDSWVRGAESPGEQLELMLDALAKEGYVSHGVDPDAPLSRSGHGFDRIEELLTSQRMIGDEEQYAVTAALMARAIGFPSRVVFGFAPERGENETIVRGSDVSAWIEVDTADHGWVPLDPTPPEREIPDAEPEEPAQVARPQSPVPPPAVEPDTDRDVQPLETDQEEEPAEDPLLAFLLAALTIIGLILLIALILSSPLIAILLVKLRRRALRQKASKAADRIVGGWREFRDTATDFGYPIPAAATRSEVADVVGGVRALVLASVADRAVFAPDNIDDDEARQVWAAVRELEENMATGRTRWQRFKAAVSMRSLTGYRVKDVMFRERRR